MPDLGSNSPQPKSGAAGQIRTIRTITHQQKQSWEIRLNDS
jgi:hypothetical protein